MFLKKKILYFNIKSIYICLIIITILSKEKSLDTNQQNILVIPFKTYFPKVYEYPNKSKILIISWIRKKLFLELENYSGQKLSMILNTQEPKMHTRDVVALIRSADKYYEAYNENVSDICSFNYEKSNTYQLISPFDSELYSISKTCYAKEKIYIYKDLNLKTKNIYDIEFIHSSNETHLCFFSGLQLTESSIENDINLFYQLKNLTNSKTFSWTLKFNSPEEGYFIFGDIINNKELNFYNDNNEDNYIPLNVETFFLNNINWKIYFEKIFFDDYIIKSDIQICFFIDIQTRYITVPKEYFYNIKLKYLLTNENISSSDPKFICHDEESEFFFHSVYCDKKEYLELTDNYKKLPTLNMYGYRLGVNITFTPKELFLEKDDKIYFFIAYNSNLNDEWHMGHIFLEKYITVFDNNEKKLSILKQRTKAINKDENDNSDISLIILIAVLVFVLSALIFSFLGILFSKKMYLMRKKKANELDDEYEYSSQDINNPINSENSLNN